MYAHLRFYLTGIVTLLLSTAAATSEAAEPLANIFGNNVVMEPLQGKSGSEACLVFVQGAQCPQESYVAHLKAIQEKVPFPLWVGIPKFADEMAIPVDLSYFINDVKKEILTKKGANCTKWFYGGHSLGGSSIASWVAKNNTSMDAEGTFVWGSYVSAEIKDPAKNYPSPVLTVGAQYDGWMARVTRVARCFDEMKSSSLGHDARYRYPVVVIPGLNHASFLSGTAPSTVQKTDLRATISLKQAINDISDVVSAFLTVQRMGKDSPAGKRAAQLLDHQMDTVTAPILDPILEMYAAEGTPYLSSFKGETPVVEEIQNYIAGALAPPHHNVTVTDAYKTLSLKFEGEFAHAKPTIKASADGTQVLTYSHQSYNWRTSSALDAANYYAAYEVAAKLKSREAIYHYFGVPFSNDTTPEPTCQELNQFIYNWTLANFKPAPGVMEYYNKYGQAMEFVKDKQVTAGIQWVNEGMTYTNTTTTYHVQSKHLLSMVDFKPAVAAGMLYCKLVSPARIVEWWQVDALKKERYWVPNTLGDEDIIEGAFLQ